VPDDLQQVVREAARHAAGLSRTALNKRLPVPYRKFVREVESSLRALVDERELFAFMNGKTQLYFAYEPLDRLDALVPPLLLEPVTGAQLRGLVSRLAPGYESVVARWLARAKKKHVLFVRKGRRLGREPEPVDVEALLATVLKALRTALKTAEKRGVSRERLADVLLAALDVRSRGNDGTGNGRADFLAALDRLSAEDPSTALLSVRALRRRLSFEKRAFDELALRLAREGVVSLHYHDFPASLPESERNDLIVDAKGTHYVGIARRG
jgi:hypothetical protein